MNKDKIKIRFVLNEKKGDTASTHYSTVFDLTDTCHIAKFLNAAAAIADYPEKASTKVIFAPGK